MRTIVRFIVALAALCLSASAPAQTPASSSGEEPPLRPPFNLKLHIDKSPEKPEFIRHFDQTPYVESGKVYVYAGERIGINVTLKDNQIVGVAYAPDSGSSDISFSLKQEQIKDDFNIMMLVTRNGLKRTLTFDASMTIPEGKGVFKTGITPVDPGQSGYESWPNPIVRLVLSNFKLTDAAPPAQK
jgi:hypothetical protein